MFCERKEEPLKRFTTSIAWLSGWIVAYLLLAGSLSWVEGLAGVAAGVLSEAARRIGSSLTRPFAPKLGWLAKVRGVPGQMLPDCGALALALWRRLKGDNVRGSLRKIPFEPGGDDECSAARRAIVVSALSLAPNTYVVSIDRRCNVLITHQLVPAETSGPMNPRWPL